MRTGRVVRWLLRAPVALYSARAGWLLGHRFLLLRHRGRRSHRLYGTVLEVVAWRPAACEAVVMSGLGPGSQWYRNVLAGQAVEVQIARLRFTPSVRPLDTDEAVGVLADYERRNRIAVPIVRAVLSKLAGFRYDGSAAARRRLVHALPLVALRPRARHGTDRPARQRRRLRRPAGAPDPPAGRGRLQRLLQRHPLTMHPLAHHPGEDSLLNLLLGGTGLSLMVVEGHARLAAVRARIARFVRGEGHGG